MNFYIGYYTDSKNVENRDIFLSATNKMSYIIELLKSNDVDHMVVSCSMTNNKCYYSSKNEQLENGTSIHYFSTFGRKNMITKLLDRVLGNLQLFIFLLKKVHREDTIIVYHSPRYIRVISFIKQLKKCRLILEVEEIYADVVNNFHLRRIEQNLFDGADAYIFPTQLLDQQLNINNRPSLIIHGTYQINKNCENNINKEVSEKDGRRIIHCVYAGILDPRKGAIVAVETALYLPSNYHVHILGFGSEENIKYLKKTIDSVSQKASAKITYEGVLSGNEYITFIQNCDIGLSTQDPNASFNATSFPSKILSYLANGLHVVSIRIPAIEQSLVGKILNYYDLQTPEKVAEAIVGVDLNAPYDSRAYIKELSRNFEKDLMTLLKEGGHR